MIITQNGFLIHARKYRETSSILYIFSPIKGIYSLIFKGKYTNKDSFRFSIFNEYQITFNDSYDFPYLSKFENIREYNFEKKYYILGLYINELIYKMLKQGYDNEKIYDHYKDFLADLNNTSDDTRKLALMFEKKLLEDLGYGLHTFDDKIDTNKKYYYDLEYGFKVCDPSERSYFVEGKILKDFFSDTLIKQNEIDRFRNLIKKIFSKIYPEIVLNGDKLF